MIYALEANILSITPLIRFLIVSANTISKEINTLREARL
jgi:hypothetical protein